MTHESWKLRRTTRTHLVVNNERKNGSQNTSLIWSQSKWANSHQLRAITKVGVKATMALTSCRHQTNSQSTSPSGRHQSGRAGAQPNLTTGSSSLMISVRRCSEYSAHSKKVGRVTLTSLYTRTASRQRDSNMVEETNSLHPETQSSSSHIPLTTSCLPIGSTFPEARQSQDRRLKITDLASRA